MAQKPDTTGSYPREDFETYKNLLRVKSFEIKLSAASALVYYPEGFELILDFIEKDPSNYSAVNMCRLATNYSNLPNYEARLIKTKDTIDTYLNQPGRLKKDENTAREIHSRISRYLYDKNPTEHRLVMIKTLQFTLQKEKSGFSFDREWNRYFSSLLKEGKKEDLYVLVPGLIDLLSSSSSSSRKDAYDTLVKITGADIPFKGETRESRLETKDAFLEFYHTKIKPTSSAR